MRTIGTGPIALSAALKMGLRKVLKKGKKPGGRDFCSRNRLGGDDYQHRLTCLLASVISSLLNRRINSKFRDHAQCPYSVSTAHSNDPQPQLFRLAGSTKYRYYSKERQHTRIASTSLDKLFLVNYLKIMI